MEKTNYLIEATEEITSIFDKIEVKYWLMYGALLGMVREGKLISWDHDIDLGIWEEDLEKIAQNIEKFHNKGFSVHFTESGHVSFNRKPIYISVMFYRKNKETAYRSSFTILEREIALKKGFYQHSLIELTRALKYLRWIFTAPKYIGDPPKHIPMQIQKGLLSLSKKLHPYIRKKIRKFIENIMKIGCVYYMERLPVEFFNNLKEIQFYNIYINAPVESRKYLEWEFGDGWETPDPNYTPRKGCKAWIKLKHRDKIEREGVALNDSITQI